MKVLYKGYIDKIMYLCTKEHPNRIPFIKFIYHFLRILKLTIIKKKHLLIARLTYTDDNLDFNKTCWVNPHEIRYCVKKKMRNKKWENYCRILDGDWDKTEEFFEDELVYQAFQYRFKKGKNWENTKWYQRVLDQISNGRIKWNCRTKKDFDERLKSLDSLYYQIKESGYKPKKKVYGFKGCFFKYDNPATLDDVAVAIDRNGQFLFFDGQHRLSIAKILNIPVIPIIIILRHKNWMDFRRELIFFLRKQQNKKLYQTFTHPDLQDLPLKHTNELFELINNNLSFSQGTILDIGAKLGHFCHKFENEGFDCYAVEENSRCLFFLKKFRKAENKKFKVITESIFEYNKNKELVFDVVLAMNGLHRYLEKEDTYLNLIELLKRLKVKELFLVVDKPDEYRNNKIYKIFSPDEFINFILENSCLNKAKYIGKTEDGSSIYKFTL